MLRAIASFFSGLAAVGLVASLVEHVAAWLGRDWLSGASLEWLAGGLFVVCVPALLASNFLVAGVPRRDVWAATFRGCPRWMRYLVYFFFAYGVLGLLHFILNTPSIGGAGSIAARAVSSQLMAFYGVFSGALYSAANLRDYASIIDE
jgi:hypothetical protein